MASHCAPRPAASRLRRSPATARAGRSSPGSTTAAGAWPADGRAVCASCTADQFLSGMLADSAGGAILAWEDDRNGPGDIYAQHLLATGAVDGGWPADGRALCSAADIQGAPAITSD